MQTAYRSAIRSGLEWDALLRQRLLDGVALAIPLLLFLIYLIAPKASDGGGSLLPFYVFVPLLTIVTIRLWMSWSKVRPLSYHMAGTLIDFLGLFAFLYVTPMAYDAPLSIALKSPTASLIFVFIAARIIFFDAKLLMVAGMSAVAGWTTLTLLALTEPNAPGVTRSFRTYLNSDAILIGAQIEQILAFAAVTLVGMIILSIPERDGLTGLVRIRRFSADVLRSLSRAGPSSKQSMYLVKLTNLSEINQHLGAKADRLFQAIGQALTTAPVRLHRAARFDGSSIILWKDGFHSDAAIRHHAKLLLDLVEREARKADPRLRVDTAIAGLQFDRHAHPLGDPMERLALAMDAAQQTGEQIVVADGAFDDTVLTIRAMERKISSALSEQRFEVHYQPIVDMRTNELLGVEALVRMRSITGELISPYHFISVAEASGQIAAIGTNVLRQVRKDAPALSQLSRRDDFFISVNVAPGQFEQWTSLYNEIVDVIETGVRLKVEITESIASKPGKVSTHLAQLKSVGAELAIDDFGTGYSSLDRLADLPFDTLKIDMSFTRRIATREGFAMIDAIVRMATASGKDVVIEGVEDAASVHLATRANIRACQGYVYARPLPLDDLSRAAGAWNAALPGPTPAPVSAAGSSS
ncbi:MAG: bifunctional diguanylate cyclase/phosphodiesterase [Pseudomonadota bacterium]